MNRFDAVYAVLNTYPNDLRSLFLDSEPNPSSGESTPKLPHIEPKESKKNSKKPSAKKTARRRASIRERLNSYVLDYSVDLQRFFDDIVALAPPETESDNINSGGAENKNQPNQSQSIRTAVYGAQYLKERLDIMLKRAKISVMPLTKKGSKKQRVKRKSRAKLLDKLNILRGKFQLIKKDEPSLEEQQISSPCLAKPVKKKIIRKKQTKKIKNKDKKNKTKSKKESRKVHTKNLKIKKKQGIRRRLGSVG